MIYIKIKHVYTSYGMCLHNNNIYIYLFNMNKLRKFMSTKITKRIKIKISELLVVRFIII